MTANMAHGAPEADLPDRAAPACCVWVGAPPPDTWGIISPCESCSPAGAPDMSMSTVEIRRRSWLRICRSTRPNNSVGWTVPPEAVRVWNVGVRLGAALRKAWEVADAEAGSEHLHGRPRPHLRRAHYHHFWRGSMSAPEQHHLIVRWIHQALVNAKSSDDLAVAVRPLEEGETASPGRSEGVAAL